MGLKLLYFQSIWRLQAGWTQVACVREKKWEEAYLVCIITYFWTSFPPQIVPCQISILWAIISNRDVCLRDITSFIHLFTSPAPVCKFRYRSFTFSYYSSSMQGLSILQTVLKPTRGQTELKKEDSGYQSSPDLDQFSAASNMEMKSSKFPVGLKSWCFYSGVILRKETSTFDCFSPIGAEEGIFLCSALGLTSKAEQF